MSEPEVIARYGGMVAVGDLAPHPANPNQGDVGAITESIEAVGFYSVIYAQSSTAFILGGEHRWRAAQALGITELPVVWLDVDDATALRILVGDNAIPRLAATDEQRLAAILVDLQQSTPARLAGTGHDAAMLDRMLADTVVPSLLPPVRQTCPHCGGVL